MVTPFAGNLERWYWALSLRARMRRPGTVLTSRNISRNSQKLFSVEFSGLAAESKLRSLLVPADPLALAAPSMRLQRTIWIKFCRETLT